MSDKYTIKFELGDWSQDGHNQSVVYTVRSNKPVNEVREAHFRGDALLTEMGRFEISDICGDMSYTTDQELIWLETLSALGIFNAENELLGEFFNEIYERLTDESKETLGSDDEYLELADEDDYEKLIDEETLVKIWAAILMNADDTLELEVIGSDAELDETPIALLTRNPEVIQIIRDALKLIPDTITGGGMDILREAASYVPEKVESLHFYGFDSKDRHLSTPGYGLVFDGY